MTANLREELESMLGMAEADHILSNYPASFVQEKVMAVRQRRARSPRGLLLKMLKEDYQVKPEGEPDNQGWQLHCYYCKAPIDDLVKAQEGGTPKKVKSVTVIYPRCSACGKTEPWAI